MATAPAKVRCSHLLVKHSGSRNPTSWKSPQITRPKSEALQILATHRDKLTNSPSGNLAGEFGALAAAESDCSSARNSGDLGYFTKGQMQKEFEDVAFGLSVGQLSGFVDTASGVHVILRTA